MGKFREKLLDFKRRLQDRKMYSIVIILIAAVAIWGFYQYRQASRYRQHLDNRYNSALYEMVGYVNNVEVLLIKSLISSTPERTASTLQEAWRQANLAQTNLGQIPVPQHILAKTSKFLTQVGDFSYALNNQSMQGKQLSDDQYKTLEKLHKYAIELDKNLNELQNQINSGRIKWGELEKRGKTIFKKTSSEMPNEQFENIDKIFQDYPTLIYDGPFSDHLTTIEPRGVTGDKITAEQGKEKVMEIFGRDKVESVETIETNDTGTLKTYSYSVKMKNSADDSSAMVSLTQEGGHIYWMLYNRPVEEKKLSVDEAKEACRKFLEKHGYDNMADTYFVKEDNTATINNAYQQQNVTVYPDLIKVKVALDNGEILGVEAKGYLFAHTERDIPEPRISLEEARAKISKKVEILGSGLAIIPTDYKSEIFVYEFKGKFNDNDFLVYINALNGREEDILLIINTEDGILTI
jgi:spore germination protein